jgi:hypothetical protein
MSPRRRRWILIGSVVVAIAVTATLALLLLPISQEPSGYQIVGLRLYSFEDETVFGSEGTGWHNYSHRGATFAFQVYCPSIPVGKICAWVTEPDGSNLSFSFFAAEVPGDSAWESWVAPDGAVASEYHPGGLVRMLVTV